MKRSKGNGVHQARLLFRRGHTNFLLLNSNMLLNMAPDIEFLGVILKEKLRGSFILPLA